MLAAIKQRELIDGMQTEYKCLNCSKILRREELAKVFGGYGCAKCGGQIMLLSVS